MWLHFMGHFATGLSLIQKYIPLIACVPTYSGLEVDTKSRKKISQVSVLLFVL